MSAFITSLMPNIITISYFIAIILFILGLKGMSSPVTAKRGVIWAGLGMFLATVVTFGDPEIAHIPLMLIAILIGGGLALYAGKKVKMTDMPQMIALFNGLGGGSAATIWGVELLLTTTTNSDALMIITIVGALIGSISFSGSLVAFLKLQGWMKKSWRFYQQKLVNALIFISMITFAIYVVLVPNNLWLLSSLFAISLLLGIAITVPIGGADMPVIISLYNALTGLAVAAEGFALQNPAMIIAGTIVGSAGTLLTQLMARAMNRSITNILFSNFGENTSGSGETTGKMKSMEINDAASMLAYASKIVIVPGYGMAVAQAQHKVWELAKLLLEKNITVKFAIHPVAGRMPGHMNVLLADAGVPYDLIFDLEEINDEFATTDVAIVIGANDVVNPDARNKKDSPIYGMPILNVDKAKNVFAVKRGEGTGFSGVQNPLFFLDNTHMLFGDAQGVASKLIQTVKQF